jgi:hypothetical protein
MHGVDEVCIEDFGGKARRKETTEEDLEAGEGINLI